MSGDEGLELVVGAIEEAAECRDLQGDALRRRLQRESRTVAHLVRRRDHVEEPDNELFALLDPVELEDERAGRARVIP